jgi:hypothetical protein
MTGSPSRRTSRWEWSPCGSSSRRAGRPHPSSGWTPRRLRFGGSIFDGDDGRDLSPVPRAGPPDSWAILDAWRDGVVEPDLPVDHRVGPCSPRRIRAYPGGWHPSLPSLWTIFSRDLALRGMGEDELIQAPGTLLPGGWHPSPPRAAGPLPSLLPSAGTLLLFPFLSFSGILKALGLHPPKLPPPRGLVRAGPIGEQCLRNLGLSKS